MSSTEDNKRVGYGISIRPVNCFTEPTKTHGHLTCEDEPPVLAPKQDQL